MKLAFLFSVAAVASALIACSSSSSEPTDSTASEDLSSTGGHIACPPNEKVCEVASDKGICKDVCVPMGAMCMKPACHVCDPSSAAPRPACHWDTTKCDWECPVCDPVGAAPRPVCHWDLTKCDWECPVCDPSGPAPQPGCKWDEKACVWLCL